MTTNGSIFITGGTGFVGSNVQNALHGRQLTLLVRNDAARQNSPLVSLVTGDVTNANSLRGTMEGCETVVHLVAIIAEEGATTFDRVIRQGTEHVVAEAQRAEVEHIIFMSALGVRNDPGYPYFAAKFQAEEAVKQSGIPFTIFRPSIMFGLNAGFIGQLADVVRGFPVIPVVGTGRSLFQPVSVTEVAHSVAWAVDHNASLGQTYDLGGPDILTYDEILDLVQRQLGTSKRKIHLPTGLVRSVVKASLPLPKRLRPPVTIDQLKMLDIDNCTARSATAELAGHPQLRLQNGIGYLTASCIQPPDNPLPETDSSPMMP